MEGCQEAYCSCYVQHKVVTEKKKKERPTYRAVFYFITKCVQVTIDMSGVAEGFVAVSWLVAVLETRVG